MAKKTKASKTAAAPAPAARKTARSAPAPKLEAVIDYPAEGELVRPGHYAIRVTAEGADAVEIRLDGTDWLACRESVGFFWHDWAPQKPGPVVVSARVRRGKGRWVAAPERTCLVEA